MAYTNATFFVSYETGSDAARTALTVVTVSNPSGTITRCNKTAHGLVTGAVVDLTLFTAWLNTAWKITVVDADNFDLDTAVWQATADASGTVTPRGGSSKADAWQTCTSGATAARIEPGDTIRIMGSPAPTSLGITGAWKDGPLLATQTITSSTNATPIVITKASHGLANGDTVIINAHTTNTKANGVWEIANVAANTFELVGSVGNGVGGASGTIRQINNCRVVLASALTQTIALQGNQGTKTNWTASANVTATVITTDFKEGGECQQINVAAGFTTGLAAYFPTGTLDLSTYQQVSFWFKQTAGTLGAASAVSLTLCSDAAGVTPVNTINIPNVGALSRWCNFTIDTAGALGASIQSIGFVVNTNNGAQTFLLDSIIASKASSAADSLTQSSLIGKNTGNESWWGIQSIKGTRVMLDRDTNAIPSSAPQRGYSGATETITTYKQETIKTIPTTSAGSVNTTTTSGISGSLISYEGGWDRTNMTTQNLETWFDGQNGQGYGFQIVGNYVYLNKVSCVRYVNGIMVSSNSSFCSIGEVSGNNNSTTGVYIRGEGHLLVTVKSACSNASEGLLLISLFNSILGSVLASHSNSTSGENVSESYNTSLKSLLADNNGTQGVLLSNAANFNIRDGGTRNNGTRGISLTTTGCTLKNFTIQEAIEVAGFTANFNAFVASHNHDNAVDNHKIFYDMGLIAAEATVRHTASGISWAFNPTNVLRTSNYPLSHVMARFACNANALVTVKAWMRRTNTGLTFSLVCKGNQIAGVANDVSGSMTAAADTWEEITITFTPTEIGVVEIRAEAYGGSTYTGYIDDMTITQA